MITVKYGDIEIKVGDRIGYIHKCDSGNYIFRMDRINTIHLGVKSNTLVCKGVSYDLKEVITNSMIVREGKMILIDEPFITTNSYIEHCKEVIKIWNEKGDKS